MTKSKTGLTVIESRVIESHVDIKQTPGYKAMAAFNHTVLCQTCLPYRDPGDKVKWERQQGYVSLAVQATEMFNPKTGLLEFVGLPFGSKARLLLNHFNTEAIKRRSKVIPVESTMSQFIKTMGLANNGRNIEDIKNQIRRLATAVISLGYMENGKSGTQVNIPIIEGFDLSFMKNDKQRTLWPGFIQLSDQYYNSLLNHAVPLDERALRALSHNAMALDIYAWLAQRLHRVPLSEKRGQFVAWYNIKEQFGFGYDRNRMDKFKSVFRKTMELVLLQYPAAKVVADGNKGYWLHTSPPPISALELYGLTIVA